MLWEEKQHLTLILLKTAKDRASVIVPKLPACGLESFLLNEVIELA